MRPGAASLENEDPCTSRWTPGRLTHDVLLRSFPWQMEDLQGWKEEGVSAGLRQAPDERRSWGGSRRKYLPPAAGELQEGIPSTTISRLREQLTAGSR